MVIENRKHLKSVMSALNVPFMIVPIQFYVSFTRLALLCLVIHYSLEFLFNTIKILNYMGKTDASKNT